MTQCRSIRKDDVNVTATQLGVKVGDKFVILPPEECYNFEQHNTRANIGDILLLEKDDGDDFPYFTNLHTNRGMYETFSCLARYEEKQEKENNIASNRVFIHHTEYFSVDSVQQYFGKDHNSVAKFEVKGLTPKRYSDILAFINNMK